MNKELTMNLSDCKTAEEVMARAKEVGIQMTEDIAAQILKDIPVTEGELGDDMLESVAGGAGRQGQGADEGAGSHPFMCRGCGQMDFTVVATGASGTATVKCNICGRVYTIKW